MRLQTLITALILFGRINNAQSQIYGCMDPLATNYNVTATNNDGSCIYAQASVTPLISFVLDSIVQESSGLVAWDGKVWTHNDNTDINLYALDTLDGTVSQTHSINGVVNHDWEEISQDSNYIYIGDFGNNANGNRTDLRILRIEKNSILANSPIVDTIFFSYADQVSFTPTGGNNTDFDCEAFIVSADSIFLFTKQWVSNKTALYSLPKLPGTYSAIRRGELDVQGLITGATYRESDRMISLCGYTNILQPFIYLLYDFNQYDFFSGNKRKLDLSLPFHQVEGIATSNGLKYYCSNEAWINPPFLEIVQEFHVIDLSPYLENYLDQITLSSKPQEISQFSIYPNPSTDFIVVKNSDNSKQENYLVTDISGKFISEGKLLNEFQKIDVSNLASGIYFMKIGNSMNYKLIKK